MATVNEKMTALADEIRILSGTQDTMSLDAMASNVDNANTAVADALSALVEKGVEVPDGTGVSGLAELIGAIEAGGVTIREGTVTFTEEVTSYTFVDDQPDVFVFYLERDDNPIYSSAKGVWAMIVRRGDTANKNPMVVFGYNVGVRKYYTPYHSSVSDIYLGRFAGGIYNANLLPSTYRWYAMYRG